jgi:penicillin-binding protein 1A
MASNLPAVIRKSWWRDLAFWKRRLLWTLIGGGSLALLAFIALLIAVYSTKSSLPSFDELKSSPNGQMIRVHAADGTVLVSLGPSYGEWIKYDRSRR